LTIINRAGEDDKDKSSASGGGIAGSPLWMSPEVIAGKEADDKSDIW
jgi:serine/threonine protein kinase